ncbi:MAG: hypothetical protein Fur005_29830 [Roseiflexaceae bacterium]
MIDSLTGCGNRAAFDHQLAQQIEQCCQTTQPFAILVLDIDHFKSINDAFGHARGDQALIEVATRLRSICTGYDAAFRLGGDEFALLLGQVDPQQARQRANEVLERIQATPCPGDPPLMLTLSIGVALFPNDGASDEALISCADRRHYAAKRAGRAQVVAEDQLHSGRIEPPARLIERDAAMQEARAILADLDTQLTGVLHLVGPEGAGWTRTLSEVRSLGKLLGYATLSICGSPAMRTRMNGALSRAIRSEPTLSAMIGPLGWTEALPRWLAEQQAHGLLITIDNVAEIDPNTLRLLRQLIEVRLCRRILVVVISAHMHSSIDQFQRLVQVQRYAPLPPLSFDGVRAWLRHSLYWEPPHDFVRWLAEQSQSLPGPLWWILNQLIDMKLLTRIGEAWKIHMHAIPPTIGHTIKRAQRLPPMRLPHQLPEFIGRAAEVSTLLELVRTHRAVAIIGLGGSGKTRLAQQVGAEAGESMRDGMAFVELAGVSSFDRVLPMIAASLDLQLSSDPWSGLISFLRQRQMILVLDNLEHLPQIGAMIEQLIDQAPLLHILMTSRERIAASGVVSFELGGMEQPSNAEHETIDSADASHLFIRLATQIYEDFQPTSADRQAIVQICRMVDGTPLGIELAAGWITTSSCQEIAERLSRNLHSLRSERHDLPARHQHVLAAVATFWERLSASERATLRRFGLFRSHFDQHAAYKITQASPFFLSSLASVGYVRRRSDGRYTIHELLRQYALADLEQLPGEYQHTRERFASYYAAFAERAEPALRSGAGILEQFHQEIDYIAEAWQWSVRNIRLELLNKMAPSLTLYTELTANHAMAHSLLSDAIRVLRPYVHTWEPIGRLVCFLFCRLCWNDFLYTPYNIGHIPQLIDAAEELANLSEEQHAMAEPLLMRGISICFQQPANALRILAQAAQSIAPSSLQGEIKRWMGIALNQQGDLERSAMTQTEALAIFEQCHDKLGQARTLVNLTIDAIESAMLHEARSYADRGIVIARQVGAIDAGAVLAIFNMVNAMMLSDAVRVYECMPTSEEWLQHLPINNDLHGWYRNLLVQWSFIQGDLELAASQCQQMIHHTQREPLDWDLHEIHSLYGQILCELKQFDQAEQHYRQAQAINHASTQPNQAIPSGLATIAYHRGATKRSAAADCATARTTPPWRSE